MFRGCQGDALLLSPRELVEGKTQDEHAREDVSAAKLATFKPSFKLDGALTATNSSVINLGAAMLQLCTRNPLTNMVGDCWQGSRSLPVYAVTLIGWVSTGFTQRELFVLQNEV